MTDDDSPANALIFMSPEERVAREAQRFAEWVVKQTDEKEQDR